MDAKLTPQGVIIASDFTPERVIDVVEERAPDGFTDVEAVASHAEREAIVRGYATMAGFASEQLNKRD